MIQDLKQTAKYLLEQNGKSWVSVTDSGLEAKCKNCEELVKIEVAHSAVIDWLGYRNLIQRAMPAIPKEQREILMSGLCNSCFNKLCSDIV